MKKLIAGFMTALIALLTVTSPVLAASEPCPIALDIVTVPVESAEGLLVVLKLDGEPLEQNYVNGYYEVMFEVSDIISGSCTDKVFEAVIVQCEAEARCHRNVAFNPQGWTEWDITSVPLPTTTTTTTLPEECPICDLSGAEIVVGVIAVLFTAAGSVFLVKRFFLSFVKDGWGVRLYKSQDGTKIQVFHKHPGIRAYHSTETQHLNPDIRHRSGIIFG